MTYNVFGGTLNLTQSNPLSMLPGRVYLRSDDNGLYAVPRTSSSVSSRAAYSVAGPQAWNQLSTSIRQIDCMATFKRHLKTNLLCKRPVRLIKNYFQSCML